MFAWEIERNGLPEDLSSVLEKHLYLSVLGKRVELLEGVDYDITGNVVRIEVTPTIANILGTYKAEFHYILPDIGLIDEDRKCAVDVDAFVIVNSTAQADDPSEFTVTSDMAIAFKGDKGDKGDPLTYDDLTPEQKAELQQPATDAISSIQEVELAVETAEGLRVQAELNRQTNTSTAILNAEQATDDANNAAILANEKAGLAATATTEANTARDEANLAATAANTKAGEANTAAGLADTARLAIQSDLASKANQTELDQLAGEVSVKIENLIVDGSYEDGIYSHIYGTIVNDVYRVGSKSILFSANNTAPYFSHNIICNATDKLYITASYRLKSVTSYPGTFILRITDYGSFTSQTALQNLNQGQQVGVWYDYSFIVNGRSGGIRFSGGAFSVSVIDFYFDNIKCINLTSTFGAGNEPTIIEFELLLAILGINYFEGKITIPAQKVMQWQLALIRKNKNAIIALGGTII